MENALTATDLSKVYGRKQFRALDGCSVNVPVGVIYGLIGPNGAGKTTLLRVVCGLQRPSGGGYSLWGVPHDGKNIGPVRRRLGAVIEAPALDPHMTARENLRRQYRILGLPDEGDIPDLLAFAGLGDTGKKKARDFSLGMRQRLGIAMALAGGPDLLLLDEPLNGLDPQGVIDVREMILRLRAERRMTVLISSHNLGELEKIATHYGFLEKGRTVREITAAELEKSGERRLRVTVSDVNILARALYARGIDYRVLSGNEAAVYGAVTPVELSAILAKEGCEILSLEESGETLESYYVNLMGGEKHA